MGWDGRSNLVTSPHHLHPTNVAGFVVATVPLTGHVQPLLPLVAELVARGHEVRWTTGAKFERAITAIGARFVPSTHDWDDADMERAFPALVGQRGLRRIKTQLREMFIAPIAAQLNDLEALHEPLAVISDSAHLGAGLYAERHAVPYIGVGISALIAPSIDTAPFGSKLPRWAAGSFLNWLVFRVMFAATNRSYRAARVAAGLPAGERMYFEAMSPELFLQPTVPAFEYPRRDLAAQVKFIGPLVPPPPARPLPAWWGEVATTKQPVILVTQGTLATDPTELIAPAVQALAAEDVVVVVTGKLTGTVPANVRVADYVPYQLLLPRVAAVVTNGGYGGVQLALAHGVPLVVAGGSEEKPEIAARVAWCGAGIDLRSGRPSGKRIGRAVKRVLAEPTFRARAMAIRDEMAGYHAPVLGADLIEELVQLRREVARAI